MPQSNDTKKDIEILNASLGGELFGIAAYQAAMGTGLLEDGVRDVAEKSQGDHKQHARRIQAAIIGLGGDPVKTKTWDQYAADARQTHCHLCFRCPRRRTKWRRCAPRIHAVAHRTQCSITCAERGERPSAHVIDLR